MELAWGNMVVFGESVSRGNEQPREAGHSGGSASKPTIDVTWSHPFLDVVVHFLPLRIRSAVDVGCGRGIGGALCRLYRNPAVLVGLDVFPSYLTFLRQTGIYSDLVQVDLSKATGLPFRKAEFDVGLALEVIEHLPQDKGIRLLESLGESCNRVIVSTPNEFFAQDEYDDNPFQRHLSRWRVRDFRRFGFAVYGVGGLRGAGKSVGYALGRMTAPFPELSTHILAIWDRVKPVPLVGRTEER